MPKVTTHGISPNELMLANVPIRMSARTSRFSRQYPVTNWVASSYMPTLSAPPTPEHPWSAQTHEDVAMVPPQTNPAINGNRITLMHGYANESQRGVESDRALWDPEDSAGAGEPRFKVEEVAVALAPQPEREVKTEFSDASQDILASYNYESQNFARPSGVAQVVRPKVEHEGPPSASGVRIDVGQRHVGNRPAEPASNGLANEAESERFRLEHAIQTIDAVNMRIQVLERNERRLKKQLKEEKEHLKNSKAEAEGALNLLVLAEEKICEVEVLMGVLRQDVDRYRGWWITEYYSLRALLAMLPRESRDDARHIAESAHSRFAAYRTTTL